MTTTVVVKMPILVDFEYEPADPTVGLAEYYAVNQVWIFGVKVMLSEELRDKVVDELREQREQLIRDAREEGLMPRSRYKEA